MTVTQIAALPVTIQDGVTLIEAASVMPNFTELRDKHNAHTHDEFLNTLALNPTTDTRNRIQPTADAVAQQWRGFSGGTKDLVQWLRGSDGAMLARVTPGGRIEASDGLTTKVKAGVIADGDFAAAPPDGTVAVNSTAKAFAFRAAGSWYQLLAGVPGTELDYKQITADAASISATTEATATTVITGNSVAFDGSRVKVEFFSPAIVIGSGITYLTVALLRDTAVIGQARSGFGSGSGPVEEMALKAEVFDTPTAAAHTYSVKAFVSGGSGTVRAGLGNPGTLLPAFLRVTRA